VSIVIGVECGVVLDFIATVRGVDESVSVEYTAGPVDVMNVDVVEPLQETAGLAAGDRVTGTRRYQ
jgi:hypothetical protein